MCKVVKNKKNIFSVMNNSKWGGIKILKDNLEIIVPQSRIKDNGLIYKNVQELLDEGYENGFTRELAEELEKRNVTVYATVNGEAVCKL